MLINWKGCRIFYCILPRLSPERKPAVSSVLGTECTCCKLHLGSRNRVRERLKKSVRERKDRLRWRERGGAFHNNSHWVKRFHNHYLAVTEMLLNKQSEQQLFDRLLSFQILFRWSGYLHMSRKMQTYWKVALHLSTCNISNNSYLHRNAIIPETTTYSSDSARVIQVHIIQDRILLDVFLNFSWDRICMPCLLQPMDTSPFHHIKKQKRKHSINS